MIFLAHFLALELYSGADFAPRASFRITQQQRGAELWECILLNFKRLTRMSIQRSLLSPSE